MGSNESGAICFYFTQNLCSKNFSSETLKDIICSGATNIHKFAKQYCLMYLPNTAFWNPFLCIETVPVDKIKLLRQNINNTKLQVGLEPVT